MPPALSAFAHLRGTNILVNSHDIQLTGTIVQLNSRIKETNGLSKFHENWAKNVTSTVFTCFHYIHIEKNAPPTGGHVFSPIPTIFKLVRDINKTNVLTNFHDDCAKIVTSRVFTREKCPAHWRPCFFTDLDHFRTRLRHQMNQCSDQPHDDWAKIVTSRVLTRKTAPPTGGHCLQDLIGTKLLTKFHEDGTGNVASRVFTSKCLRTDGHTTDKDRSKKLT
ncbi:hypothetical protein DPMN_069920 [Dreissena polymorpha]|uniref:Uncharacterized protein n=1 Tax=Dreissena polymorpha TaxID=45954 RepID=A0A9D3YZW4_DREPO|nr:hypothetical protein DPMN_069920 [Dreissena polymorpha]